MKTSVIGLGYVGLPLCLKLSKKGVSVLGIDTDVEKIKKLNNNSSYLSHIPNAEITAAMQTQLRVSCDFEEIGESQSVIICVPTPLNAHREPDLSFVINTGKSIAPHLVRGILVVLESTTYPGTTEGPLREILEQGSGLIAGKDFHLAYSPEREDPGNIDNQDYPRIVGGFSGKCLEKAVNFYQIFSDAVIPVPSCKVAEAAKLLENIFRAVNIALVNELKILYDAMDIDIWEVIEAAKTKPFGFMPFYPGPGLGGHCIPIDPFYLTWKAREYSLHTRFIELAGEINSSMPIYVVDRVCEVLNKKKMAISGSRILIIGIAYKPNISDVRESPAFKIMNILIEKGANIFYYDPYVFRIPPTRENISLTGKQSIEWNYKNISDFDIVLISTAHGNINYEELGEWASDVVDTRNVMANVTAKARVWKA